MLPDADAHRGPELELDWELGLFKGLRGLWRRLRGGVGPATTVESAGVADDPERWRLLASLLAGRSLDVVEVAGGGGSSGGSSGGGIVGAALHLPRFALAPTGELNAALLLVRVAVDATTCGRLGRVVRGNEEVEVVDALGEARRSAAELCEDLPRFAQAWEEARGLVCTAMPEAGELGPAGLLWGRVITPPSLVEAGSGDDDPPPAVGASEAVAKLADELTVLNLAEEDERELPLHAFEKVEMLEAFGGSLRQLDGDDELDAHLEALDEVDLGHLVRGGPQAHSVLRADVAMDAEVPDLHSIGADEHALAYDEWDARKRRWRKDWCRVYPSPIPAGDDAWAAAAMARHGRLADRLHRALLGHRQQRLLRSRQTDGDDVDVDALVGALADLRAGRDPGERLYTRRPRVQRDVATTVLLDISLSTDAWVDDRRVLDVSREAVLVLGEVAERLGDRLQVLAFASHTRHTVRVWTVRDWDEPWRLARTRLGRLSPQGYTRIGPALRYATDQLVAVPARERLLLLVSDGKPTDYDRYEGRYGMGDVRMALCQARDHGVHVHALAIDAVARQTLPMMMGPGGWDVLPHPDLLPEALTRAWGRTT